MTLLSEGGSPAALPLWAALVGCYLLGAIPFGFTFARLKGVDLRAIGSGNIGATNTMRAIGKGWGLVAFGLDFAKGWVPVRLIAPLAVEASGATLTSQVVCGTAAVLGHCFPVYLGFRGGKGVATGCGAIVGIDPLVFLGGGLVWLATILTTRFVGLASILMGVSFPLLAWWLHPAEIPFTLGASLLTLLILIRHRANITRMLAGTEPRLGRSADSKATDG